MVIKDLRNVKLRLKELIGDEVIINTDEYIIRG